MSFHAVPDNPDPVLAKHQQEIIGGQFGKMSVAKQYLFQCWNTRGNEKYKDLLMDTGIVELGHIEMIATMVARLLEGAPVTEQEKGAVNPVKGAIMGGYESKGCISRGYESSARNRLGLRCYACELSWSAMECWLYCSKW